MYARINLRGTSNRFSVIFVVFLCISRGFAFNEIQRKTTENIEKLMDVPFKLIRAHIFQYMSNNYSKHTQKPNLEVKLAKFEYIGQFH